MEGGFLITRSTLSKKKKRSQIPRKPRLDSQLLVSHSYNASLLFPSSSSSSLSHGLWNKVSGVETIGGILSSSDTRDCNLYQPVSMNSPSTQVTEDDDLYKNYKGTNKLTTSYNGEPIGSESTNKRSSDGVLALPNWKNTHVNNAGEKQLCASSAVNSDRLGNESKVKKVKLKLGSITRTIHANSTYNGMSRTDSSIRISHTSEASRSNKRPNLQGNIYIDDDHFPLHKRSNRSGVARKDSRERDSTFGKQDFLAERMTGKEISKLEAVRKSRRMPKRHFTDGEFGEDDEDDEIRYLEKLKNAKITAGQRDYEGESGVKRKFPKISDTEKTSATSFGKDGKKARTDRASGDIDYEKEEEPVSDGRTELKKKQRKESVEPSVDTKREMTLTTRQRALQSSKDGSSAHGADLIEFPNGLPPAPPRKQKEKLSDAEQQLRKAEAAQRRKMQNEKAARESEAEAIKKILGQDSARKKREEQKKRQEQLAQEKAANELLSQFNCIRVIMGPNGTTVTFPRDTGFPAIFDSRSCSYPPPREKCAGPSCKNAYKYRDSKTNLPLCSLLCYKAIHGKIKD